MRNHLVQLSHFKGNETQEENDLPKIIQLSVAKSDFQSSAILLRSPGNARGLRALEITAE